MNFDHFLESHKEGLTQLSIMGFNMGVEKGEELERKRIIQKIYSKICHEYLRDEECDHIPCSVLHNLMKQVERQVEIS
jgi:hypothetical protein